jgi:two-component system, chemotaxis family, CheB/CheR fusion protein
MEITSTTVAGRDRAPLGCCAWPGFALDAFDEMRGSAGASRRSTPDPRHPFTFDSPVQDGGLVPLLGVHVMLVEDNFDARNIIRRVLEHCGAFVTVAETARAALRRLRAMPGRPHVLVSDIALPAQDGYWLLRQVRALGRLTTLPAIAITAHRNEYDREETLAAGFQDYFHKPLDLVAFSRAIARLSAKGG